VEDELTRDYLTALWSDNRFMIAPAGNAAGVGAMVSDARADHLMHVFGVADRDFRPSNHANWAQLDTFVFRPPAHEVENYLLDATALVGCAYNTAGKTVADVEAELLRLANTMTWWMACRTVISQIREIFWTDFIEHPKCANVNSRALARQCLVASAWYTQLPARTNAITPDAQIDPMLDTAHTSILAEIASGGWRTTFSGKELFQGIHHFIYPHVNQNPPQALGAQRDIEVAKAVAARQNAVAIPPELADLYQTIKTRRSLP